MVAKDPKVDAYLSRATIWLDAMVKLRSILLRCGLDEGLKWGKPCYMVDGRNVAIIQPFKKHCCLMFFKGALLDDPHNLLRAQGPNSRSAMRLEFTSASEIRVAVVTSYVQQAIAVEEAGGRVRSKARQEADVPSELSKALSEDRRLAKAFHALTPGRQRGYILHVAGAKRAQTRIDRIERCIPKILAGKGMHDR